MNWKSAASPAGWTSGTSFRAIPGNRLEFPLSSGGQRFSTEDRKNREVEQAAFLSI